MASDPESGSASADVPISLALLVAVGFLALCVAQGPSANGVSSARSRWASANQSGLAARARSPSMDSGSPRSSGRSSSGSGQSLARRPRQDALRWKSVVALHAAALPLVYWSTKQFPLRPVQIPGWSLSPAAWQATLASTFYLTILGLSSIGRRLFGVLPGSVLLWPWTAALPRVPQIRDGIVLGAIHERGFDDLSPAERRRIPEWLLLGLKGLTGNIFITGVIGSGKSQILLQFLKQALAHFTLKPAMLAIDPKRTLCVNFGASSSAGLAERLVWISLGATCDSIPFGGRALKNSTLR